MNFAEILAELIKHYDSVSDFYETYKSDDFDEVGGFNVVHEQDRNRDMDYSNYTEELIKVFYFPNHDVYIKVTGEYSSYSGQEFNGWASVTETKPEEKTIIVYN